MDIVDYFKQLATGAEQTLGKIAGDVAAEQENDRALRGIEARFEAMAQDGELSQEEMRELDRLLRARGVDPAEIEALYQELRDRDGAVEGAGLSRLSTILHGAVGEARARQSADPAVRDLQIQAALDQQSLAIEAASSINKMRHDAYMNVINNIKG